MNKREATEKITNYSFWEKGPTREEIKECIKAGADLSRLVQISAIDDPDTIISVAARKCPDALEDLVKAGADVNQQSPHGLAAIHIAAEHPAASPKTFQKLIDLGADIHQQSQRGDAYDNCLYGNSESFSIDGFKKLEILINNGADPNRPSKREGLPLLIIAKQALNNYNNREVNPKVGITTIKDKDIFAFQEVARKLEFLIKHGADIHKKGKWYNEKGELVEESFYSATAPYIPFVAEMADFLSTHKKEDISEFIEKRLKSDEKYFARRFASLSRNIKKGHAKLREELATDIRNILYDASEKDLLKRLEKAKDKAAEHHVSRKNSQPMVDPAHPEFYKKNLVRTALKFRVKDQDK